MSARCTSGTKPVIPSAILTITPLTPSSLTSIFSTVPLTIWPTFTSSIRRKAWLMTFGSIETMNNPSRELYPIIRALWTDPTLYAPLDSERVSILPSDIFEMWTNPRTPFTPTSTSNPVPCSTLTTLASSTMVETGSISVGKVFSVTDAEAVVLDLQYTM